jgi:hypothetical protein
MTTDTAPRHVFVGDWPVACRAGIDEALDRHTGVGPTYIDELCPSCNRPISTTGECRCS